MHCARCLIYTEREFSLLKPASLAAKVDAKKQLIGLQEHDHFFLPRQSVAHYSKEVSYIKEPKLTLGSVS